MRLDSVKILTLFLTLAGSGTFSGLKAQGTSVNPDIESQRCVNWVNATVPNADLPGLVPVDFCSGIKSGSFGAWSAVFKCGASPRLLTGTAPKYCASFGYVDAHEAWAAGFSSPTSDGRELLDGASDSTNDSQRNAVTFYSRTAVSMGSLRMPAGMYELIPSKSQEGWNLTVAKLDGEWNSAQPPQQNLGMIKMTGSTPESPMGKDYLEIWSRPFSNVCGGGSPNFDIRELHFILGSTDLLVCIRPEQVPQSQEANISER